LKAGYASSLEEFSSADIAAVVGKLSEAIARIGFPHQRTSQTTVWQEQVWILQNVARTLIERSPIRKGWHIVLEYEIPRRQKRPDSIILAHDVIFVIEFKVGADRFEAAARWQTEDYALDLRDFHAASAERLIVPILTATQAHTESGLQIGSSSVWPVQETGADRLADLLDSAFSAAHNPASLAISPNEWIGSPYRPALTIVEAAEALFNRHDVREISHSYAENLSATTSSLVQAISDAQRLRERRICFVTGVPGAGKTLTGLNAVHDPQLRASRRPLGVFLSGNGPLVKIVRAALVQSRHGQAANRKQAKHEVGTFIQNVHGFLRHYIGNFDEAPPEHVAVWDEAQRAWNARQMERKQKISRSEPELLLDIMARCPNWCVLIALVGGGQEIHQGEAGLAEWGRAIADRAGEWAVVASPKALEGGASVAGQTLFGDGIPSGLRMYLDSQLHLAVSVRSFRAQRICEWVNDVLSLRPEAANSRCSQLADFPFRITGSLAQARAWL